MPIDPVTIYKQDKQRSIAAVDLAGWIADGWSPAIAAPKPDPTEPPKPAKVKPREVAEKKSIEIKE